MLVGQLALVSEARIALRKLLQVLHRCVFAFNLPPHQHLRR
jgi:hypothetical protein